MHDHLAHLPPPPVALVEREDGVVIRRNPYTDVRVADRQRRENEVPLQRGAPRYDPPDEAYPRYDPPDEAYPRYDPPNAAYRDWHDRAWAGYHPDPLAENRYRGENDGFRVEDRGRD